MKALFAGTFVGVALCCVATLGTALSRAEEPNKVGGHGVRGAPGLGDVPAFCSPSDHPDVTMSISRKPWSRSQIVVTATYEGEVTSLYAHTYQEGEGGVGIPISHGAEKRTGSDQLRWVLRCNAGCCVDVAGSRGRERRMWP